MDGNTPKIADFGLARSCRLKSVTHSLDVKGTPPYMSPEHFFDFRRADQQADVYSLGKILYEAMAGKITSKMKPFKKESLENPETPFFRNLDQIIQNSTAEIKTDRLESVDQLHNFLLDAIDILKSETATAGIAKPKHIPTVQDLAEGKIKPKDVIKKPSEGKKEEKKKDKEEVENLAQELVKKGTLRK